MTQHEIEIWIFYPKGNESARQIGESVRYECSTKAWSLSLRPTGSKLITVEGKPVAPVSAEDAINLYKRVHRASVGVWQIGNADVMVKPNLSQRSRGYISLRRFIENKAFFRKVQAATFHSDWCRSMPDFHTWTQQIYCNGENDPRCLPFHIFSTQFDISHLSTSAGQSQFLKLHGPQSSWIDQNHIQWKRPSGAYHGQDTLNVSGCNLAKGFHWDVSNRRAKQWIIEALDAVWKVQPRGYLNIYPDGHIRRGKFARKESGMEPLKSKAR